jgi:hypothetical protein
MNTLSEMLNKSMVSMALILVGILIIIIIASYLFPDDEDE